MFDILAETQTAEIVNWPLEIAKMAAPAVLVLLGLWIWHHKKRSEPRYESLSYLRQKKLDCLLKAWSLLAYITEVENPKAVILWEKTGSDTKYYLRSKQAREYMIALGEFFYKDGYGLLLGREIKQLLYEYRGHLFAVLLKSQSRQDESERIKIENDELVKRMKDIYNNLNAELQKELKKIEK